MSKALRILLLSLPCIMVAGACLPPGERINTAPRDTVTIPEQIDTTGARDVSAEFSEFLASVPDGTVVELRPDAKYRMESTLVLADRHQLTIDGNGALIFATTPGDRTRANVRVLRGSNIAFIDLQIRGANPYAGLDDRAWVMEKEAQHGIDIRSVTAVSLVGVTITDVYGDFVYIGKDEERPWTDGAVIRGSQFARNGRMGISITAARNVVITQSRFDEMRRSTFDLEAHHPGFGVDNVTISDNDIGKDRLLFVANKATGPWNNVTIQGNRLSDVLDILSEPEAGEVRYGWRILDNTSTAPLAANPHQGVIRMTKIRGLEVKGNYQEFNPLRDMHLVRAVDSCQFAISGNRVPGAVGEALTTGSC